eukprot:10619944-Alexandrium_andersonii.AAC.1
MAGLGRRRSRREGGGRVLREIRRSLPPSQRRTRHEPDGTPHDVAVLSSGVQGEGVQACAPEASEARNFDEGPRCRVLGDQEPAHDVHGNPDGKADARAHR